MGNLSLLSRLVSVACRHWKQPTRGALWTELCQLGIFSSRLKRSVNLPLLQISVVAGFANQLETYLARRTFIAHCSLLLRASMGGRWHNSRCRPCERRLKNYISFKTVISESQSSFETVKRCTEISPSVPRPLPRLCICACMEDLWVIF